MQQIYIADDNKNRLDLIKTYLENDGFTTRSIIGGTGVISACEANVPDLIIINVQLSGVDGLSVCSRLHRTKPELPIVLISDKDDPYERVTGFTLGCDDYLVIPFLPLELVARVRAILRRSCNNTKKAEDDHLLVYGALALDLDQRTALISNVKLPLTPAEFDFLAYLVRRAGTAVSRKELLKNLWQSDWQSDTRAVDDLVKRLRRKLKEMSSPVHIETVWGYGFRLALDEAPQ